MKQQIACPTCGGIGVVYTSPEPEPCPDCTNGRQVIGKPDKPLDPAALDEVLTESAEVKRIRLGEDEAFDEEERKTR